MTDKHFFWSGKGKLDSIVRSWQTRSVASLNSTRFQTVTRTDCATLSLWNCFSRVCQLSVLVCSWDMQVFASPSAFTIRGIRPGKSNSKQI